MIISQSIIGSDPQHNKVFSAPKGMMYEIFDIHLSIVAAGNNNYAVLNYAVENNRALDLTDSEGILALINSSIIGQAEDFNFSAGEKTKFITLIKQDQSTSRTVFIIHYELVIASRTELIIEWFRKGR